MSKRGQKKIKKEDFDAAQDVEIIEETSNKNSQYTDLNSIDADFEFEKPPTSESIPLNTPLAGETSGEGQTMKQLGFDVQDLGSFDDVRSGGFNPSQNTNNSNPNPSEKSKTISFDDAIASEGGIIDDIPPPNPSDKDLFDKIDGDMGSPSSGGGTEIPADFVAWSADKQAEWIVSTEKIFIDGFMQNRARISTIDVKQKLIKYKLPSEASKEIVSHIVSYNTEVENNLSLSKEAQKVLKMSWAAVLKQHSNISEKITPEVALVINHAMVVGQMWFQGNEIKKYGKDLLMDIDASLQSFSSFSNQSSEKKESK